MNADTTPDKRPAGRKLAEWVTISLSTSLVALVAGYLVYQAVQEDAPFVPADVRVLLNEARHEQGKYIVPLEVRNRGRRTIKNLKIQMSYRTAEGGEETADFTIDYLGEKGSQKIYTYVDQDPAGLNIKADPRMYELE